MSYEILKRVPGEAWQVVYEYDRKADAQHDLRGMRALHSHLQYKIVKAPAWKRRVPGESGPGRPNPAIGLRYSVQVSSMSGGQLAMHSFSEHAFMPEAKKSAAGYARAYPGDEVLIYDSKTRRVVTVRKLKKGNPAGIRAQVRRLPSGQIQLRIPLKSNPVLFEDVEGKPLGRRIDKVRRYGEHMLKGSGLPVQEIAQRLRGVLGKVMNHATITVDDGKGNRAYNPRTCNPSRGEVDRPAASELEQFISSDAGLYRQQYLPILKNLATKKARGIYDHAKAVKLFMYLMESGAKKYNKEHGDERSMPWHELFNVPTRMDVAEDFAKSFEVEYGLGNYDRLLPKKYQKKANPEGWRWQGHWVVLVKSQSTGEALSSLSATFPTEGDARIYRSSLISRGLHRGRIVELLHNTGTNAPGGVKVVSSKAY